MTPPALYKPSPQPASVQEMGSCAQTWWVAVQWLERRCMLLTWQSGRLHLQSLPGIVMLAGAASLALHSPLPVSNTLLLFGMPDINGSATASVDLGGQQGLLQPDASAQLLLWKLVRGGCA